MNLRIFALAGMLLLLVSCTDYPKDTYQTFEKVNNGTLLVGYAVNPPWIIESEKGLEGIEVRIVKRFARSINARINWVKKNEQTLLEDLEQRNLHIVISGLTSKSPWGKRIGMTGSYLTYNSQNHVIALPPGENRFLFELDTFLNNNKENIKEWFNQYTGK